MGLPFAALRQRERAEEGHHRLKAVQLFPAEFAQGIAPADGENLRKPDAVSPDDIVVKIPRIHRQGFFFVKITVQRRGLEMGQIQQPFIHHGQHVRHGTEACLAHGNPVAAVGFELAGHGNHRFQEGFRVVHHHRHHAVRPDGEVVLRL